MTERRFYLQEIFREGVGWDSPSTITESELKRRFRLAVEKWRCDQPWDKIKDILLHGG